MEGIDPRHVHEVRRWLGLVAYQPTEGLHAAKRTDLVARNTRRMPGEPPQTLVVGSRIGATRTVTLQPGASNSLAKALAKTYPVEREAHIMALLQPQPLSDRLWRWVYALMVTGGPISIGELVQFLSRLTGPTDIARAEAERRYRQWLGAAHA